MRKSIFRKSVVSALSIAMISSTVLSSVSHAAMVGATGWKQDGNVWRHYEQTGKLSTGWVQIGNDWYYLNPNTGEMKTGWLKGADGSFYYLNANVGADEGKMLRGWHKIGNMWYFFNTVKTNSEGRALSGWQWIDGNCYYFGGATKDTPARMYANERTPDGYFVNADGKWAKEDGTVYYVAGKGINTKSASLAKTATSGGSRVSFGGGSSGGGGGRSYIKTDNSNIGNQNENAFSEQAPDTVPDNSNHFDDIRNELLVTSSTKIVDLGWIKYAVVHFEQGIYTDYDIFVDGTNINSAVSKIDDAGKLVKWATTVTNPKEVKVVRKSDNKEQIIAFAGGNNTQAPSEGSLDDAPAYILTNGPVSVFDYHIDNYDREGKVRKAPTTTTFDLGNERDSVVISTKLPKAYYSPDALIDSTGRGTLTVKVTLNNDSEEWFDNLTNIKLLDVDNRIINSNLIFETAKDTTYGNTGIVTISLPQSNFTNRGRYYINMVSSADSATYSVPVHIVSNVNYKAIQSTETPNPKVGEDILFKLEGQNGETFGNDLRKVVNRVELKYPSGKIKSLKEYSEYSVIFYSLHIYGTDDGKDGTGDVLTDEAGIYEVSIYADGYKKITKRFEVLPNAETVAKESGVDVYSSATGGGSGSVNTGSTSEGSGGSSSVMNAWLIFDHDLLANALILNELGLRNEAATNIINRWHAQHPEGVLGSNVEVVYDQADFLNSVKEARLDENRVLTFAEYSNGTNRTLPYPGQIKRVLEDGLLGTVERLAESRGQDVEFTDTTANEGENFEIGVSDNEYLSKITGIFLDGNGVALRNDDYLKQYEIRDGKIVIYASTISSSYIKPVIGEHTLKIYAEGYKAQEVKITVKGTQADFELELNNNLASHEGANPKDYFVGEEVSIKANANFLSKLSAVRIKKLPNGDLKQVLYSGQGGRDKGYKIEGDNIILENALIAEEGRYKLFLVTAFGQKNLEFEIKAAVQGDNENLGDNAGDTGNNNSGNVTPDAPEDRREDEQAIDAPTFASANKGYKKYLIKFGTTNDQDRTERENIKNWLAAENLSIKVNETVYSKALVNLRENTYRATNDPMFGGVYRFLELSDSAFVDGRNSVEISADGYKTLRFVVQQNVQDNGTVPTPPVNPDGGTTPIPPVNPDGGTTPTPPTNPDTGAVPPSSDENSNIYKAVDVTYNKTIVHGKYVIKFGDTEEAQELKKIQKWLESRDLAVKVNGNAITKYLDFKIAPDRVLGGAIRYMEIEDSYVNLIDGDNTVEISANGYETVEFVINKNNNQVQIKGSADDNSSQVPDTNDTGSEDKEIPQNEDIPEADDNADEIYTPIEVTTGSRFYDGKFYSIKFGTSEDREELLKIQEWLNDRNLSLKVNGKSMRFYMDYSIDNDPITGGYKRYIKIFEKSAQLKTGENIIEISSKGNTIKFKLNKNGEDITLE